jgi:hypothetical protein
MNKYEIFLSFTKKDMFTLLGIYLVIYGVFNIASLFLKDIFFVIFK